MEWQFKPQARQSFISEEPFNEGDKITCFIFIDENNEIQRADILEKENEQFQASGGVLGRWTRIVKNPKDEEREAQQQALATTEEIFLSLFAEGTMPGEEKDVLKQILALMLERKRILRAQGKAVNNIQTYLYSKTKEILHVPVIELTPERLQKIESHLQSIIV